MICKLLKLYIFTIKYLFPLNNRWSRINYLQSLKFLSLTFKTPIGYHLQKSNIYKYQ